MSNDQLKCFVEHLGELSQINPNVLFGNHIRRMNRDRRQDIELLQVMHDWWESKLCEMTQDKAMDILIRALSQPEVNCNQKACRHKNRLVVDQASNHSSHDHRSKTRILVDKILHEMIWKRVERVCETLNLETATVMFLRGAVGV